MQNRTNVTFSLKNRTKSKAPHSIKADFIDLTMFVQGFPRYTPFTFANSCFLIIAFQRIKCL